MYQPHTFCRACGYARPAVPGIKSSAAHRLVPVLDLGIQPLANDFRRDGESLAGYAPLKVLFCPRCSLAQLSVVVDPGRLYRNYAYVTSPSEMMRQHFVSLMQDIDSETNLKRVVEIGSNDGRLLAMMQERGYEVQGVDPAENLSEIARSHGIPTRTAFFSQPVAQSLGPSDIVIARHVFCHIDDWHDFVRGLEALSHPETLICLETPYAGDLIKNGEFDTIYHEHLSYLSFQSVVALLENTSLQLHRILHYPIHGGTAMCLLRRKDSQQKPDLVFSENITEQDWRELEAQTRVKIGSLRDTVNRLVGQGKRVAGLGASAKSTVWINACGFTRKQIGFIADNTPQKQYTFSPGTDIPVVDEGAVLRDLPDYVVLFAWNYRNEILDKFSLARSQGVKFIIPIPQIDIV